MMSSPTDEWSQFYNPNRSMFVAGGNNQSDATVVTTTVTTPSNEGRVSRPVRRRSRASRRTPTTLLNTDTSNFRAMVQQFTGAPTAPFGGSGELLNVPATFSFTPGQRQTQVNPSADFHFQYQYQQPSQGSSYMFPQATDQNISHGGDHLFFQRLGNPRPLEAVDQGFMMEGISSQAAAAAAAAPPPSAASNENRSNSFLF
ncbi:VQ motif-containing protein 22 [Mercurialis annua]|uniref:VQ motif-containing protein 22 n=1 Tax=Mercurialis annua TaxID=3986 RepID=UPI00215EAEB2|nr:VQ motif-containing protein 22 [Mercurialis annua]